MCHISVLNVSGWWQVINVIDIGEENGCSWILTTQQTLTPPLLLQMLLRTTYLLLLLIKWDTLFDSHI